MKKQLINVFALGLTTLSLWNCKTSDPEPTPYDAGVYVVNSGNFSENNGTISYIARNSTTASTDIFNVVNGRSLVGYLEDYTEINGKGVILVDNSAAGLDKIEIVESGTFKSLATLAAPDVENPRNVIMAGPNKAYISCWGTTGTSPFYVNPGYILVVDLASRTITKKIPVNKGADRMIMLGNQVFVGNVGGERTLTVINTDTDEVQAPGIDVGVNPNPLALDANNKLWVYTSSTKEMVRINPANKAIENRLVVGSSNRSLGSITINSDKTQFYFVNFFYDAADSYKEKGETYRFSITDANISTAKPFISRYFTGLSVDPQTGVLYAGVSPSYKQAGYVLRYQPGGALIDSVKVEIGPTRFFFR